MILKFNQDYSLDFGYTATCGDGCCQFTEFYEFDVYTDDELHLTPNCDGFAIDNFVRLSVLNEAEYQNPFLQRWIVDALIREGFVEKIA